MEQNNKKQTVFDSSANGQWRLKEWFPELSEAHNAKLQLVGAEIRKRNADLKLVSEKTLPFLDIIHFSDSILAARAVMKDSNPTTIAEFGSGTGFPGLVMSVLYPDLKVLIFEQDSRKVEFLQGLNKQLGLRNLECDSRPIDSVAAASLEYVVTRGFGPITKGILLLRKQVKKNGCIYMMKGEEWPSEVSNIPTQLCSFWYPSLVADYHLPLSESKFSVVKLKKMVE